MEKAFIKQLNEINIQREKLEKMRIYDDKKGFVEH